MAPEGKELLCHLETWILWDAEVVWVDLLPPVAANDLLPPLDSPGSEPADSLVETAQGLQFPHLCVGVPHHLAPPPTSPDLHAPLLRLLE
eukprot:357069-Lingulodinium_polyedra.AAC.1